MKIFRTSIMIMVLAVVLIGSSFSERVRAAESPDGVVPLFNGKNLDGFYTWLKESKREDPHQVFRVTDGMLHVTGDGLGGLVTNKEYRDYHSVLEFKWGTRVWGERKEKTKDSGMLVHSIGADGGYRGIWMPSIEVQIIEGGVGDFIMVAGTDKQGQPVPLSLTSHTALDRDGENIWKEGGQRKTFNMQNRGRINWFGRDPDWEDVLGFRGKNDVESPDGQWTRLDTICDGGHIQVFVNGVKVNEAFDSYPSYGRLQLQSELAEIFVRRWELWPIGKVPDFEPASQK